MSKRISPLAAGFVALAALAPLPAAAEFLSPDWAGFSIEGVAPPGWVAGVRDGGYIGMCVSCEGTMMLQVKVLPDDGTGGRVRSGQTTVETYTKLGKANADRLGGGAAYYGTEEAAFASAVGFKTLAQTATGDYSATYQLWDDGHQLLVRVFGADRGEAEALAGKAFKAAAPLTFK